MKAASAAKDKPMKIIIKIEKWTRSDIQSIKESLANYCERFGDIRLIDVTEDEYVQDRIGGQK